MDKESVTLGPSGSSGKIDVVVSGSLALAYLIIDDDVIEHHS